jgi:hypothetical protein
MAHFSWKSKLKSFYKNTILGLIEVYPELLEEEYPNAYEQLNECDLEPEMYTRQGSPVLPCRFVLS